MANLRILYVASEITPFLSNSHVGDFIGKLVLAMQAKDTEIRILVPRFGVINERKNKLHEVVRLSGTKIMVGNEEQTLTIKVASIPGSRLQVYFLDNECYFHRKNIFLDKEGKFFIDNDERLIFFCKGALETVKNLEWTPDIIHCHDWVSSLLPLYLRTTLKNDPIFKQAKIVFTVYNHAFSERFRADFVDKVKMIGMENTVLQPLAFAGFKELIKTAVAYADQVSQAENLSMEPFKDVLQDLPAIPYIGVDEAGILAYYELYKQLIAVE